MKNLPNIERSGFHRGQYVGYANGPWHIRRDGTIWRATRRTNTAPLDILTARTLTELSGKLTDYASKANPLDYRPSDTTTWRQRKVHPQHAKDRE